MSASQAAKAPFLGPHPYNRIRECRRSFRSAISVLQRLIGEVSRVAKGVSEPTIDGLAYSFDAAQLITSAGRCFPT